MADRPNITDADREFASHLGALDGGWYYAKQLMSPAEFAAYIDEERIALEDRVANARIARGDEQLSLDFNPPAEPTIEETVAEPKTKPVLDPKQDRKNSYKNWGISKSHLLAMAPEYFSESGSRARRKNPHASYNALECLFYGLNIVESPGKNIGLPDEALQKMNSSDIIAMYIGIGQVRRHGSMALGKTGISYNELVKLPVEEMVSKLVGHGFRYSGIRHMRGYGYKDLPTAKGNLKERIAALPDEVKDQLKKAIMYVKPDTGLRKKSDLESFGENDDFRDPNQEQKTDPTARRMYCNWSYSLIKSMYDAKTR